LKKTWTKSKRNSVGSKIRQIRQALHPKVTLEDLEARVAVRGVKLDRSALGRIEKGTRYVLDYEAAAIARALRIPIGLLFE
jgi:transcriptional regulator with XRE-family HTH domain